jgi:nucleotide-binding universal stress UspA family protein
VQLLVTDLTSGEQLVKFAEDEKIDQIFLGIIKKSKVGKFLFGSTAQFVILNAPCPVVTVQEYPSK